MSPIVLFGLFLILLSASDAFLRSDIDWLSQQTHPPQTRNGMKRAVYRYFYEKTNQLKIDQELPSNVLSIPLETMIKQVYAKNCVVNIQPYLRAVNTTIDGNIIRIVVKVC